MTNASLALIGHGTTGTDRNGQNDVERGIHLRWAFRREMGFPPGCFRLYRRPSNEKDHGADHWEPLREPICLPINYSDIIARLPTQPGILDQHDDESARELFSALRTLVDPHSITAQADRLIKATAEPDDCMPDEEQLPDDIRFPALDAILMAAVAPIIARVVGLYYVDKGTDEGQLYDYKVEGYWPPGTLWQLSNTLNFDEYPPDQRFDLNIFSVDELTFLSAIRPTILDEPSETAGTNYALAFQKTDSSDWNLPSPPNFPISRLASGVEIHFPQPVGEVQIHLGQETPNVVMEAWDGDRRRRVDVLSGKIRSWQEEHNDRIVADVVLEDLKEPALRNLFAGKRLVQHDAQGNERALRILESSKDTPWANRRKVSLVLSHPAGSSAGRLSGRDCTIEPGPSTREEDVLAVHGYRSTDQITRVVLKGEKFWLYKICWQIERIAHGTHCAFAYGLQVKDADPLQPPSDVKAVALPGLARKDATCRPLMEGATSGTRYSAGVSWKLPLTKENRLLPKSAVRYHIWRQKKDNQPELELLTRDQPAMVAELDTETLAAWRENCPEGWPDKPPHFVDSGLKPGKYCWRVAGIDVFGRVSIPGRASGWIEVKPPPPPPPANLAALFVDRGDPWLDGHDLALVEDVDGAFRLRWRWPNECEQMAPAEKFHIHYLPGTPNVLQGRITQVDSDSSGRTDVTVELAGLEPAPENLLAGRLLSQGGKAFRILSHTVDTSAGTTSKISATLRLPDAPSENRPVAGVCSVALEATVPVSVTSLNVDNGGVNATVKSTSLGALPCSGLAGGSLVILGVEALLDGANLVTVKPDHIEMTISGSLLDPAQGDRLLVQVPPFDATLRLPPPKTAAYQDYSQVAAWPVTFDPAIPKTTVEDYNLVLRRQVGGKPTGLTQTETEYVLVVGDSHPDLDVNSSRPLCEGHFGVSSEGLGGQGPVSAPARVVRVFRGDPVEQAEVVGKLRPSIDPEEDYVLEGPPNFAGKLRHEFPFTVREGWRYEVFRALDETLFSVDRAIRKEAEKPSPHFLDEEGLLDENAKREWLSTFPEALCRDIKSLIIEPDTLDLAAIEAHDLHNSLLQALASLPYNDRAFTRLNLDVDHLKLDGNEMICIDDTIEGRAAGRYFYRVQAYDPAGNAAPMALSSQPIYVRGDLRLAAPVITAVEGGDRQITLHWAVSIEPNLAEYRIYRAENEEAARDLRLMTPVHTADRDDLEWTDGPAAGLTIYYYRLVAVDAAGSVSNPSRVVVAQAYDDSRPEPPVWTTTSFVAEGLNLNWSLAESSYQPLVQRRDPIIYPPRWENLTSWLPVGTEQAIDTTRVTGQVYTYRLRVKDEQGQINRDFNEIEV